MFLFKLKIWNHIQHNLGFGPLIQKWLYLSFYVLFYKFINFKTFRREQIKMIISSSFSCLLFHWCCFNVSLFCQCSIIVLHCSAVFRLFRWCSMCCSGGVLALFRCSSGVPYSIVLCSGVPGFIVCRAKMWDPHRPRPKQKNNFFQEIIKPDPQLSKPFYFNKIWYVLAELWMFFYIV